MAWGSSGIGKLANRVHTCECLKFLKRLPDASIDFCMTSPPYWKLRDYGTPGQIGQEKTPEEYIEKLVTIFRGKNGGQVFYANTIYVNVDEEIGRGG